ncbi:hypothetical protein [Tenacibaculum sp. 190524A02b]|uniref:hypothetical protein n=1 Tax=Tenacibaculum vairaonense TaxID=3137860 RepID=UPI0031FA5F3F
MATKLLDITTNYRRFTQNQVLTEGQLNEMVNYFDDQDRLSRVFLSGVGLLCGFKVSYRKSSSNIIITQGTAITTDGDLLKFYGADNEIQTNANIYRFFKPYDNDEAKYKPHFYKDGDQLEIYELFTLPQVNASKRLQDETEELEELIDNKIAIEDAVVLLYLEEYDKQKDLCVSLSCDNQGLEVNHNLKVLLVSTATAKLIMQHDTISNSQANLSNTGLQNLPDLIANRVLMQPEDFSDYIELKREFTQYVFKNDISKRTLKAYEELFSLLRLNSWYQVFEKAYKHLFEYESETEIPPDFQYRYDILKDIIDTYNEIKEQLRCIDYNLSCTVDIKAFPKHIMLGKIQEEKTGEYRHNFYKSPIFNECKTTLNNASLKKQEENTVHERIWDIEGTIKRLYQSQNKKQAKLYSLVKRSLQLLINYNANYTNIRITPSFELGKLSKKAIPFYNNVGKHLISLWDFEKTIHNEQRKNRSYHTAHLDYKKLLDISIDADFYRIEGHQGKNYKEVIKSLQLIRRKKNLSFNIIALKIKATPEQSQDFLHAYTRDYLYRNHGYEHKAGVVPGGTFILIYIDSEYDDFPRPYGYGYPYNYPKSVSLAGDFIGDDVEEPIIVNAPVVADFSIPYLCCDENNIHLSLPVKEICFDEHTLPIPFNVMPKKGFVEAEVEEGLNGGVTINKYGEFVLDTNLVSKELHGKPISYTVNNFETNCVITVNKKPKFEFIVDTLSEPTPERIITVTFKIQQEDGQEGVEYTWDFGDGSTLITTSELSIAHDYFVEEEQLKVEVTLIGVKNGCSTKISEKILLEIPKVELSLPVKEICFDKTTLPLAFAVLPIKGIVAAVVREGLNGGVTTNDVGAFIFNPNLVSPELYNTPIPFTVNGFATNCQIIVWPKPSFRFEVDTMEEPVGNRVTVNFIIIQTPVIDGTSFTWNFGDGTPIQTTTETRISHTYQLGERSLRPLVVVQAKAGVCTSEYSESIIIDVVVPPQISIEPTTFCRNDNNIYPFKIPDGIRISLSAEGITVTDNGQWAFEPSNTSSSTITVFANGSPTDLILTILDIPAPIFNAFIEGELLILENESEITEAYNWNVNGIAITRRNRRRIELLLSEIPNTEEGQIVVTMQTVSENCGESDIETMILSVPVTNSCVKELDNYTGFFEQEYENLKAEIGRALDDNVATLWSGYSETIQKVKDFRAELDTDENVEVIIKSFFPNTTVFDDLLNALEIISTGNNKVAVRFLAEAYINIYYLMWCCKLKKEQTPNPDFIQRMDTDIREFLGTARSINFNIDEINRLKSFLEKVQRECGENTELNNSIINTLNNLNFAVA